MFRLALLACVTLLSACSDTSGSDTVRRHGWSAHEHRYRNFVSYSFGDLANTYFAGTCDSSPVFSLNNGDYPTSGTFELVIDGRTYSLPVFNGPHGRKLLIRSPDAVAAVTAANQSIGFRVGQWHRQLQVSPLIRNFAARCVEMRKEDPDANGIPG